MAYSLNCDDDELDPHYCGGCEDNADENARIGSGAWVHADAYSLIAAAPTNAAVWNAQKALGLVIILPELLGSFDGGAPVVAPGYGRLKERISGYNFSSQIKDPVYKKNFGHYKSLVGNSSWHYCYNTSSQSHLTSVPVTVSPKNPITENLEDSVIWDSAITWFEPFTPAPFDTPAGVFDCVNPVIPFAIVIQPENNTGDEGGNLSLNVAVQGGTGPYTYQWQKDGVDIVGATTNVYSKSPTDTADSGSYTCVITDSAATPATLTSNAAVVTISAVTFDTMLEYTASVTDTAEGVTGTVAAINAVKKFEFNLIAVRSGTPKSMTLLLAAAEEEVIDFLSDYTGAAFRCTDGAGATHTGVFADGDVTLT